MVIRIYPALPSGSGESKGSRDASVGLDGLIYAAHYITETGSEVRVFDPRQLIAKYDYFNSNCVTLRPVILFIHLTMSAITFSENVVSILIYSANAPVSHG